MFRCMDCGKAKPVQTQGGTGYAIGKDDFAMCYACCGLRDRAQMVATGKAVLYLITTPDSGTHAYGSAKVTNWPNTRAFTGRYRRGHHNRAGHRYDAWFKGPDGKPWHGVQYGDNTQIVHCNRIAKQS